MSKRKKPLTSALLPVLLFLSIGSVVWYQASQSAVCTRYCPQSQGVRLFVEPDAKSNVVLDAIMHATRSIWIKAYLLTDDQIIGALKFAAKQGKDVRVILEEHPFGGGGLSPREAMAVLEDAGVQVKFAPSIFRFSHEKSMVIDGNAAYIMTMNLTKSGLGSRNREYGIIANDSADVRAVQALFESDWNRTTPSIINTHFVISPITARGAIVSLIRDAQKTIQIEAETVDDDAIEQELTEAAIRGVDVHMVVPTTLDSDDRAGVLTLKQNGVKIEDISNPYMHAKVIIVDGKKALIGSVNISTTSLDRNRELSIIVSDEQVLRTLEKTFQEDWKRAVA